MSALEGEEERDFFRGGRRREYGESNQADSPYEPPPMLRSFRGAPCT